MKNLILILLLSICSPAILLLALALAFIAIMIVFYAVGLIICAPSLIAMWIDEHKKVRKYEGNKYFRYYFVLHFRRFWYNNRIRWVIQRKN